MTATNNTQRIQVLTRRIGRLAGIYLSKPVTKENANFHYRTAQLQCECIEQKRALQTRGGKK